LTKIKLPLHSGVSGVASPKVWGGAKFMNLGE